jgi:hypothetical protein
MQGPSVPRSKAAGAAAHLELLARVRLRLLPGAPHGVLVGALSQLGLQLRLELLPDALHLARGRALVHHLDHPLHHARRAVGVACGAPPACAALLLLQLLLQLGDLLLRNTPVFEFWRRSSSAHRRLCQAARRQWPQHCPPTWYCRSIASLGSSFTVGLFWMFLARLA